MLRCSATRAMTRTLHEPWPKPKRPPSARDPPSQSAAPPENRRVNQPETVLRGLVRLRRARNFSEPNGLRCADCASLGSAMGKKRPRFWQHSVLYQYVRSRQLEGTMAAPPSQGAYLITAKRVRTGWGILSEKRWPYDTRTWPPVMPPEADDFDRIASYNRILGYCAVRNVSDARACYVLSQSRAAARQRTPMK